MKHTAYMVSSLTRAEDFVPTPPIINKANIVLPSGCIGMCLVFDSVEALEAEFGEGTNYCCITVGSDDAE